MGGLQHRTNHGGGGGSEHEEQMCVVEEPAPTNSEQVAALQGTQEPDDGEPLEDLYVDQVVSAVISRDDPTAGGPNTTATNNTDWAQDTGDPNQHGNITTSLYGEDQPIHSAQDPDAVLAIATSVDPANAADTTAWLSDIHNNPDARAAFVADMPAILDTMTPEQIALVGSIFVEQGHAFESSYAGDDMTGDPEFQAMAELYRAWGDETSRRGQDPLGNEIDVAVSSTSEDWGANSAQLQDITGVDGVHSDMNLPYSMWTEEGNLNRYAAAETVWFMHGTPEEGTRPVGRADENGFQDRNVTMGELQVANEAVAWVPGPDGQLYMVSATEAAELNLNEGTYDPTATDLGEVLGADLDLLDRPFLTFEDGQVGIDGVTSQTRESDWGFEEGSFTASLLDNTEYWSGRGNSSSTSVTADANQLMFTGNTTGTNEHGTNLSADANVGIQDGNLVLGSQLALGNDGREGGPNHQAFGGGNFHIDGNGQLTGVDGQAGYTRNGVGVNVFGAYDESEYTVYDAGTDTIGLGRNHDWQVGGGASAPIGPATVTAEGYVTRGETTEFTTSPENVPGLPEAMAAGDQAQVTALLETYFADRRDESGSAVDDLDFADWAEGDGMSISSRDGAGGRFGAGNGAFSASLGRDGMNAQQVEYEMLADNQLAIDVMNMNETAWNATATGGPFQLAAQIAQGNATGTSFTVDLESEAGQARLDTFEATGLLPGALDLAVENGTLDDLFEGSETVDMAAIVNEVNADRADGEQPLAGPDWSDPAFVEAVLANEDAVTALGTSAGDLNGTFMANPDAALDVEGAEYQDIVSSRTRSHGTTLSALGFQLLSGAHTEEFIDRYYRVGDQMEGSFLYNQTDSWMFSGDDHTTSVSVNGEGGSYLELTAQRDVDTELLGELSDTALDSGLTELYANGGEVGRYLVEDPQMIFTVAMTEEDVGLIDTALENDPNRMARYEAVANGVEGWLGSFITDPQVGIATQDENGNYVVDEAGLDAFIEDQGGGVTMNDEGTITDLGAMGRQLSGFLGGEGANEAQALAMVQEQWDAYEGELDFDTWCAQALVDTVNVDAAQLESGEMTDLTRAVFTATAFDVYDRGALSDGDPSEQFGLIDIIWDMEDPDLRDRYMRELFYNVESQESGGESPMAFHRFLQDEMPAEVSSYLTEGMNTQVFGDFGIAVEGVLGSLGDPMALSTSASLLGMELGDLSPEDLGSFLEEIDRIDTTGIQADWEARNPGEPWPYEGATASQLIVPALGPGMGPYYIAMIADTDHFDETWAWVQQNPDLLFDENQDEQERARALEALVEAGIDPSGVLADWEASRNS